MELLSFYLYLKDLLLLFSLIWILAFLVLFIYWGVRSYEHPNFKDKAKERLRQALYGAVIFIIIIFVNFLSSYFYGGVPKEELHYGDNVLCKGFWLGDRCVGEEINMFVDPAPRLN